MRAGHKPWAYVIFRAAGAAGTLKLGQNAQELQTGASADAGGAPAGRLRGAPHSTPGSWQLPIAGAPAGSAGAGASTGADQRGCSRGPASGAVRRL